MNIEEFVEYCLSKPGVEETTPFGPDTLVMKVLNKMFAACGLDQEELTVNLKCDPQRALELRENYHQIIPGWHMNKKHWNTVEFETGLSANFLKELIDHSYDLVVSGMTKKQRTELDQLNAE